MDKTIQNIYDNNIFFNDYNKMREKKINANELLEIPTIKKMLPDLKNKTILDIGCGAGEMSKYFSDNGAKQVLGIDISDNMLKLAVQNNSAENINYLKLAMEELETLNLKFDIVFSSLAFHYVNDYNKLMADINNLLNDGGILVFSQEHPVVLAPILINKNMEKYIEVEGKRYYLLSDYHVEGERQISWVIDGVVKYHRNFSTLINMIVNNNFALLELQESKPTKEAVDLVEKYKHQQDRPYFIFIKAMKTKLK